MLRAFWGRAAGQAMLEFALVSLLVGIVMTYSLYSFGDALLQATLPPGYALR